MPTYYRTDQSAVYVSVAGVALDNASWSVIEGGDNVATSVQIRPGGMSPQVELGGMSQRSTLTVKRPWSDSMFAVYKQLDNGAGKLSVTLVYQLLDANGNAVPNATISYTGILLSAARPNYDSESNTKADLVITVGPHGPIT